MWRSQDKLSWTWLTEHLKFKLFSLVVVIKFSWFRLDKIYNTDGGVRHYKIAELEQNIKPSWGIFTVSLVNRPFLAAVGNSECITVLVILWKTTTASPRLEVREMEGWKCITATRKQYLCVLVSIETGAQTCVCLCVCVCEWCARMCVCWSPVACCFLSLLSALHQEECDWNGFLQDSFSLASLLLSSTAVLQPKDNNKKKTTLICPLCYATQRTNQRFSLLLSFWTQKLKILQLTCGSCWACIIRFYCVFLFNSKNSHNPPLLTTTRPIISSHFSHFIYSSISFSPHKHACTHTEGKGIYFFTCVSTRASYVYMYVCVCVYRQ